LYKLEFKRHVFTGPRTCISVLKNSTLQILYILGIISTSQGFILSKSMAGRNCNVCQKVEEFHLTMRTKPDRRPDALNLVKFSAVGNLLLVINFGCHYEKYLT